MDTLNEKIEGLVNKAEKSKMPYGILKKVYDRGMAAWKTGHRPGTTPQQWAFARVNSFITKSSGTWGKADADLAKQVRGEQVEEKTKLAKDIIGQIREAKYEIEFQKGEVDMVGMYDLADIVQDELKDKRIRAKVTYPPTKNYTKYSMEFNTSVPKKKVMKALEDIGYTVNESVSKSNEQGDKMNEERCPKCDTDPCNCVDILENRQLTDPKKETMVMKKTDVKSIMVIDKKDLQKYTSKGYIQVESNDVELNIESLEKDDEKSVKKVIKGLKKAVDAHSGQVKSLTKDIKDEVESNLQEKEMTYTVVHVKKGKEVIKAKSSYDAAKKFAKMKGLSSTAGVDAHLMEGNITEQTVFVVRFEKEGLRFATPFHDMKRAKEGEIILKKTPGVSYIKITKDVLKPGIFLNNPVKEGIIVKEENLSVNLMEFDGTITIDTKNSRISKQLAYHLRYDLPSEFDVPLEMDGGEQGDTHFFMAPDMENRDVKKFAAYLKKKYGNSIKLQLEGVEQVQEVLGNSLMAQATRVISQTAIKEKIDPADVDMKATDLDRKAADKNIFIQLKRAQDMKGRADVEFLDKKKQKVDIRVINKALDMFDKLKPADKAKMQTAMGKSYRDLLKVVQRGKV